MSFGVEGRRRRANWTNRESRRKPRVDGREDQDQDDANDDQSSPPDILLGDWSAQLRKREASRLCQLAARSSEMEAVVTNQHLREQRGEDER